jgi:hypothetical protein
MLKKRLSSLLFLLSLFIVCIVSFNTWGQDCFSGYLPGSNMPACDLSSDISSFALSRPVPYLDNINPQLSLDGVRVAEALFNEFNRGADKCELDKMESLGIMSPTGLKADVKHHQGNTRIIKVNWDKVRYGKGKISYRIKEGREPGLSESSGKVIFETEKNSTEILADKGGLYKIEVGVLVDGVLLSGWSSIDVRVKPYAFTPPAGLDAEVKYDQGIYPLVEVRWNKTKRIKGKVSYQIQQIEVDPTKSTGTATYSVENNSTTFRGKEGMIYEVKVRLLVDGEEASDWRTIFVAV